MFLPSRWRSSQYCRPDATVVRIRYQIDATTKFGGIYTDFSDAHHPHLALGESLHAAPDGTGDLRQIHLHVGTGGITIQKMPAATLLSLN